jgi:cardiolipin synthase
VTVDGDLASVGSSNVDIRSFTLNAEANLLVYGPAQVEAISALQESYFAGSTELTAEAWARRPFLHTIAENLARLISPLL